MTNGNDVKNTKEETQYLLVESDSIIGHYKYNYKEVTSKEGNITTLKKYLKNQLHIRKDDIDTDTQIIIQASNGYYNGKENTAWLQEKASSNTIITDGKSLVPTDMFIWPIPGYTKITSHFGMRTHPITGAYKLHSGTDVGAPIGANFVAMADGIVIKACYSNSYGNMVMIDHRKWNYNIICTWF